ncbi:MAG: glycosyltransferase family 39 protein [Polyangiaceae bacterium]
MSDGTPGGRTLSRPENLKSAEPTFVSSNRGTPSLAPTETCGTSHRFGPYWVDTLWFVIVASLLRSVVVLWASRRFPPAADGTFYQVVASRIGQGLGYTWLWPDGVVTYAAHYPVGYPALLGGLYAAFGNAPVLAMWLNALAGVVIVLSVHRMAIATLTRRAGIFAGVFATLHPTLLFYTPAMMTELVSACLLVGSAALVFCRAGERYSTYVTWGIVGLLTGLATLVRPQQLLWAPILGAGVVYRSCMGLRGGRCCGASVLRAVLGAAIVTTISVSCCLPWTLRNCDKMQRCVFVSANGGWNLFIGTSPLGRGAWTSIDSIGVPKECRLVFKEAEKDNCFGEVAKRVIGAAPHAWLALVPAKLSKTFDDVGAPGYYLNASNPAAFGEDAKWWLGAAEVFVQRVLSIMAILAMALTEGSCRRGRWVLAVAGVLSTLVPYAWVGVGMYVLGVALLGRRLRDEPTQMLLGLGWAMTAVVHSVFFGGARYAIVVAPLLVLAASRALGHKVHGEPQ